MGQLFKNNAFSTLASALTAGSTTLTVASGQGDLFPVVAAPDFAILTLQDEANNIEIVRVTARASNADSMTIQRAQEGTTARAWGLGKIVDLRITASAVNPLAVLEGAATAAAIRAILLTPTRTGGDASGTWGINITGNAATATVAATAVAAGNASVLASARTFTIGATGKAFDGSANVAWTLAEIGAAAASATLNLTGDQSAAGVKTWTGQQLMNGGAVHSFGNVVGAYTGIFGLGGRNIRKVTASNAIEVVNAAASAVTHTLADNGDFTAAGNVTAYSDERLKKDWNSDYTDLSLVYNLAWLLAGSYTRVDTGDRQVGVSAQALRLVMPEAVLEDAAGMLSVAYGNASLVAVVALAREVISLRERLAKLEAR